ncbi:MAG TPA: hypothetical protein VJB82_01645 [Candidatus Peribacterales bacterium]|nr:hypothetical protein [Candidatus Peribacterales bacterium]
MKAAFEAAGGREDLVQRVFVSGDLRPDLPETNGQHLLVRCFNKTEEDIAKFLKRCREKIQPYFPLDSILIVIDTDADTRLKADTLKAVMSNREKISIPVVPVLVSGPSSIPNWTRKLNGGLKFLHGSRVSDGTLLITSFDSVPSNPEALGSLSDAPVPILSVRDTPAPYAPKRALKFLAQDDDAIRSEVQEILSRVRNQCLSGNPVLIKADLDILPAVVRNSMMVWKLRPLFDTGGFDPYSAKIANGQEDTAKVIELLLRDYGEFPDDVPVLRYADTRFQTTQLVTALGAGESHTDKYNRERTATTIMAKRLVDTLGIIPIEERDFQW